MKKLVSIVAILVLVFALCVPAMAATPSITTDGAADKVTVSESEVTVTVNGEEQVASVEVSSVTEEIQNQEELQTKAADAVASDAQATIEVVDVTLELEDGTEVSEEYFADGSKLQVAFVRDDAKQVAAVLYYNETTGVWDKAEISVDGNTVTATFEHLCAVAFVLAEAEETPDDSGNNDSGTNGSGSKDAPKSPKTGYNTIGWAVTVAALVLAAGYCFVSSRKVTE